MIQDGNYTHASDVWAFAVLGWELYTAFATGQEFKEYSVPYCNHAAEEVCLLKTLRSHLAGGFDQFFSLCSCLNLVVPRWLFSNLMILETVKWEYDVP